MSDFGLAELPEPVTEGPDTTAYFQHLNRVIFDRFEAGERDPSRLRADMPAFSSFMAGRG